MNQVSRRDLIRWSLLGAGAAPLAAWLSGCSSEGSIRAAPTTTRSTTQPPTTLSPTTLAPTTLAPTTLPPSTLTPTTSPAATVAFDPERPWWMQGNFAPVATEVESTMLEVVGAIPPELSGLYVRNGSNPASGDSPHWFFGDGMAHGVRLGGGKAEWYRNRYVHTSMYETRSNFGQGPPGGASNQSNVSCIWHAGRLLTSGEVGLPYELDPSDLSTRGAFDFGGTLSTSFTAHPKIDPDTGRMHFFGYGFTPPYLTYHIAEADGTLVHSEVVEIPRSTMIHDFAITSTDVVFWDLPVIFDLEAAVAYIDDPSTGAFPYQWTPEAGSRVGVMPLAGGADQIQWFEVDPCYVFHGVNAYRSGPDVTIDVCHLASMFAPGEVLGGEPSLRRWVLNTDLGSVTEDVLEVDHPGDLPTRDPRRVGRQHRHGYLTATRDNPDTVDFGGLIKHDFNTGTRQIWDPGPTRHSNEWLFVPDTTGDTGDDDGYLLSYVHDDATGTTELVILDATAVTAGPVASIALPQRVPYGFHAAWVATD